MGRLSLFSFVNSLVYKFTQYIFCDAQVLALLLPLNLETFSFFCHFAIIIEFLVVIIGYLFAIAGFEG